jgi:hypothetical protein
MKPLAELAALLAKLAEAHEPDFRGSNQDACAFVARDLGELDTGFPRGSTTLTLQLEEEKPYILTAWARGQLLTQLGAREKWFRRCTPEEEAEELTRRKWALDPFVLRRAFYPEDGIGILRGLVTTSYAEIPDVAIMEGLLGAAPEGMYLPALSGKTDRAFYAYVVSPHRVGTKTEGALPGAVIRNSEVGYTALSVTPFLLLDHLRVPVVLRANTLLRRAHRGSPEVLRTQLTNALAKLNNVWGSAYARLLALHAHHYADVDAALEALELALAGLASTKRFTRAAKEAYLAVPHSVHTARGLLDAVLQATPPTDADTTYIRGELAGLLLHRLL